MELLQAVPPNPEGDPTVIAWIFVLFIAFLIVIYLFVIKAHKDSANRFPMPNPSDDLVQEIEMIDVTNGIEQDACRFCQFWKESLSHPGIGNCLHPDFFQQRTQSTHHCELFRSTGRKYQGSAGKHYHNDKTPQS